MSSYHNALDMSPVPAPGPDAVAVAPEPFHGIYGMPSFVTIPTADLAASVDFWTRGLDFFELFSVPGQLVHLRRWTFQDVLLVPDSRRGCATSSRRAHALTASTPTPRCGAKR